MIRIACVDTNEKHVLMLREDHYSYCWLLVIENALAESPARVIINWCTVLVVKHSLMCAGHTKLRNKTLRMVRKGLKIHHHFTLSYTPESFSAMERLQNELLRVFCMWPLNFVSAWQNGLLCSQWSKVSQTMHNLLCKLGYLFWRPLLTLVILNLSGRSIVLLPLQL